MRSAFIDLFLQVQVAMTPWICYCIYRCFITVRNSSCGKVMFSQVVIKNSVHRWGCLQLGLGGIHILDRHPQADSPLGRHPLWQKPPSRQTSPLPEMATVANCTHPTGMHSCYHPQMKLWEGYVFTGVCDSVHGGGVCIPACTWATLYKQLHS